MSIIRGIFWELDLPSDREAERDDACVTLERTRGVGALQIRGAQKDVDVTDDDLRDFASEHLDAGAVASATVCGRYSGFNLRYGEDRRYWRMVSRSSRSMLLAKHAPRDIQLRRRTPRSR
jgi:hypothetical protein